ncbi:GH92 family glycosyl hydrolase [Massilia terrae]|uniref:GH92 family glycosyl hydrolase n=1 Tax=Massilia terrae TaxID=1811224 RepID=A0ABT2CU02_9BURK|nr:GH92 family glycosyl hydrolase [Massilia terrae]MCS0657429.1 GH92 family glycosyl hydrolase [Massilia terrae]
MRRKLLAAVIATVLAATATAETRPSLAYQSVDPMIGTGGDGHTYPGATTPFGMIQLSPDTEQTNFKKSYKWAAGYQYGDSSILGFSHTHFSGSGHSDLGDVLVMPIAGEVKLDPGTPDAPRSGYRSQFSHATEHAEPGYYAVTLADYNTRAELTASARVGWHRYTFPAGQPAHVLLDLRSSIYDYEGKVLWSTIRVRPDGTVTGARETRGWAPGRQLFFAMRFSAPMTKRQLIDRESNKTYRGFKGPGTSPADTAEVQGKALEAVFDFGKLGAPLLLKVAVSTVSEDNAVGNLDHDAPGWDFDGARAQARGAWEQALAAVDVDAPEPMRKSFYTALYHSMLAPNLAMDWNGEYRGPDHQVHFAQDYSFYSTWSTWDTYRAEHPLMTLVQPPQRTNDFVNSLIAAQKASPFGILPVWAYQGLETWCMIGYHSVPIIADAYMKGIRGYSIDDALKAMTKSATYAPYAGLGDYMKLGYVAIDKEPEAASKTLEYAFDDWTIAQVARSAGRKDLAATFEKRAANWRNVFDPATGFVRARKTDGSFNTPFDPAAVGYGSDYTEGNAWQYSWYVPQDIGGLQKELGGADKLSAKLDALFEAKVDPKAFAHVEDISGLIGYYAHGNEPSHHIAYLYGYTGQPWRTQERLKQIMDSQYSPTPTGLAGNDDLGQMSAWYVFTAMGFYPVAPASNQYVIGRPFVSRATVNLPNGKRFTVVADSLDDAHPYIGKVTLNGKPLDRVYLRHEDIEAGGELRFEMQAQPNKDWGRAPGSRPFSMSGYGS